MYPLALADPMQNLQVVDPVITQLLGGQPGRVTMPSSFILKNISVSNWSFKWNKFGTERFRHIDTERAMRAEIRTVDFEVTQETGSLRRFSLAAKADQDELANASPSLKIREKKAALARQGVILDIETKIKDLLTTATNYPVSHRLALGAGSEWNAAGGDSRSNIREMARAIGADTGIPIDEVSVFVSQSAYEAALDDPIFLAARQNYDTDTPDKSALTRYWGVKEVLTAGPITVDSSDQVSQFYGDVAILFVRDLNTSDWDTEYGEYTFAVNFQWNRGVALEAWFERLTTTWWFPYQAYANPEIVNSNLGAIITNCAA